MSTARGELTPDDVHNVAFSTPPSGKRGYDEGEVEALRRRLEEHLRNPPAAGGLTAAELDNVAFSKPAIGKRGYDPGEVDAFLKRAAQQLRTNVGSGPAFAAAHGDFRGDTGQRSKPRYEWAFLPLAILATTFSLVAVGIGLYDVHGYRVGTPTTAKIVDCTGGRNKFSSVTCRGQWSVDGKSYTGRIAGDSKGHRVGSSLDVRVRGSSAYTATSGNTWFIMGAWAGAFAIGCFAIFFFSRRRPTEAAPTAGRHSRN